MRLWFLTTFRQDYLKRCFRNHVCGLCGAFAQWLPSAPGFDAKQCIRCKTTWDDSHPLGRIRGRHLLNAAPPIRGEADGAARGNLLHASGDTP